MDVPLLIDAIVRQTTVLIAHLATASGSRATLANTANHVFLNLVTELKRQGLTNKVIADMFGLALRTYHNRMQRLSESSTVSGRSVWEAVLEWVKDNGPVTRAEVLGHFVRDEATQIRAVLHDLVGSQLLVKTGRGDRTTYRLATGDDLVETDAEDANERLAQLVWVAVHRYGPLDRGGLAAHFGVPPDVLDSALARLLADGRVTQSAEYPGQLQSDHYQIPVGSSLGWEAAIFDHYQALVTALCIKVRSGQAQSAASDWVGGSTYCYDVWEGHPLHDRVATQLREIRNRAVALREEVESYNREHERPSDANERRFTTYVGQSVIAAETDNLGEIE